MKTEQPIKEESTIETPRLTRQKATRPGNILVGLLLVFFGIVFLLQNSGIVELSLSRIWQLWPLFIVAAGLSLMSVRGWLATSLVAVFIVATVGLIGLVALGIVTPGSDSTITTQTSEVESQDTTAEEATVSITSGAGKITIDSDTMSQLVKASLESNITSLKQTTRTENGIQNVEIAVGDNDGRWIGGTIKNDLDITLNESTPLIVHLNTGASSLDADLSDVTLRTLNLKTGASTSMIKLGSTSEITDVSIEAGMSSVKLLIPESSGLRLDAQSPMSSLDVPDLRKISDTVSESANYDSATNKINVTSRSGMTSLKIEYY